MEKLSSTLYCDKTDANYKASLNQRLTSGQIRRLLLTAVFLLTLSLQYPLFAQTAPQNGVLYEEFLGDWNNLPDFDSLTAVANGTIDTFDISIRSQDDYFGFRFKSCLSVAEAGTYTFYTSSDDGSQLFIDNSQVVDNDGLHAVVTKSGTIDLDVGMHAVDVTVFEKAGDESLTVEYEGPGVARQEIPADVLFLAECRIRPFNSGVAAQDSATGIGYIMYSAESVHTRFAAAPPHNLNADHFIAVKFANGEWQYDDNESYVPFVIDANDILLAQVDFSADTVTMLSGVNKYVDGFLSGYASGDIDFLANGWDGGTNDGEFGISGSHFVRHTEPPGINEAPTIEQPEDETAVIGDHLSIQITASDPDEDALTYSAEGLPADLTIDPDTGEIGGILTATNTEPHLIKVTVSDGEAEDSANFQITGIPRQSEAGVITIDQANADQWHTVNLQHTYKTPVVIMGTPSFEDAEPLNVRVRSVTPTSFEFQLDEWDYLDGVHGTETVGYVVAEAGAFTLQNGQKLWAGEVADVTDQFSTVTFAEPFDTAPIVLAQVASTNEPTAVTSRLQDVQTDQFNVRVQEQGAPTETHLGEHVYWIAVEPVIELGNFETQLTAESIDDQPDTLFFNQTYSENPIFLAAMQTFEGNDPAALRHLNLTPSSVDIFIEEEQSDDDDTGHVNEAVGFMAIDMQVSDNPFGQPPNVAPTITNPGDQTNFVNEAVSLQIIASDVDDDSLSYAASNLPDGLSINPHTGLISGTLTTINSYAVSVTVDDGRGGSADALFTWTVNELPNNHPVLENPGNQVNIVGDSVSLQLVATDVDDDVLTFGATNLPDGLAIDDATGVISGTVTKEDPFVVVATVEDDRGGSDSISFVWIVNAVPNNGPVVLDPGNQQHTVNTDINLTIEASDPDNDPLTFSALNLPPNLAIDPDTGVISGTLTDAGRYTVVVSANDGNGGIASTSFIWEVTNSLPQVTNPGSQTHEIGEPVQFQVQAVDADGDELSYTAVNLPPGLTIRTDSGLISGSPTKSGDYNVTLFVDDSRETTDIDFMWQIKQPHPVQTTVFLPLLTNNYRRDEPNDACTEAYEIGLNAPLFALHEDKEDWYTFTTTSALSLDVELSNFTAVGQIVVYRGDCSNLTFLKNNGNFASTKLVNLGPSPAATYYVRIITDNNYQDPTNYRLIVNGS